MPDDGPQITLTGNQKWSPTNTIALASALGENVTVHTSYSSGVQRHLVKKGRKSDFKSMNKALSILRKLGYRNEVTKETEFCYDIPDTPQLIGYFKQCHPTMATIVQIADNGDNLYIRAATATQHTDDVDKHGKVDSYMNAMMKLYSTPFQCLRRMPKDKAVCQLIPVAYIERIDSATAYAIKKRQEKARARRRDERRRHMINDESINALMSQSV